MMEGKTKGRKKVTLSITVDYEAYILAKDKLDNISQYLNNCLLKLKKQEGEEWKRKML